MGKHFEEDNLEKTKKRINKKVIIIAIILVIFIVFAIFAIKTLINYSKAKNMDDILDNIDIGEPTDGKTEMMLKLEALKTENNEIVGWIKIDGTNISYPVLQGTDNSYYLNHNYKKEKSIFGSLFLDKDYDFTIPSSNLLIYGHRDTKGGTMFEDLVNYKKEDFYKEHQTIKLTTMEEDAEYDIIAVFLSRVYYKSEKNVFRYYYFVNAEDENQFDSYVSNSKKASLYDTGKTAEYGEQLLTLSTCEYSQEDGRLAIVAKKIVK